MKAETLPVGVVASSSGYAFAFSGADPGDSPALKTLLELGLTSVAGQWARADDSGKFEAFAKLSGELGLMPLGRWPDGETLAWTRIVTEPLSTGPNLG